jgi:hypothetical protein
VHACPAGRNGSCLVLFAAPVLAVGSCWAAACCNASVSVVPVVGAVGLEFYDEYQLL